MSEKNFLDILTWPGNGVYTVQTGADKKKKLTQAYYQTEDFNSVESLWKKSFEKLGKNKALVLGIPSDCGAGIVRGSNWGPLALRNHFLEHSVDKFFDLGDIRVVPHLLHDKYLNKETIENVRKSLYGDSHNYPVSPLSQLEFVFQELLKYKKPILTLGGDHSISYPTTKAWLESDNAKAGILHFDAHTDLLDSRLGIDFCFGSWAYHTREYLENSESLVQVGIRSSGYDRGYWESKLGIKQIWSDEVRKTGPEKIAEQILKHYQKLAVERLYVSFDVDAIDAQYASATGTPEYGGLEVFEVISILDVVSQKIKIEHADIVEVAPFIRQEGIGNAQMEPESTLESASAVAKFLIDYWNS
ncbi:MAG: arginase family protein [Halobacteriovoraceae bacterium]|nr:arginase family protein [Halobacteriovoraceae bacterium]MCB9095427.1 arginase family protein [Halobacteriovoraceae bacterium]